jgi:outer membrane protein OmpA-like peptidoglycan-associated protein
MGRLGLAIWILGVGLATPLVAQVELGACDAAPEPNKEVLKAEQALDRNDLNMAQVYLNAIERKSPEQQIHFYYLSAEWNLRSGKPAIGASLFNQIYQQCPDYHPDIRYKLAMLWASQGRALEANALIKEYIGRAMEGSSFLAEAKQTLEEWELVDSLKANPVVYEPYRIQGLDTDADEFLGVLSPDENYWFFTKREEYLDRKSGPAPIRRLRDEFCIGKQGVEGVVEITPLGAPFNQGFNEGGPSLTADNRWMVLTSCQLLGSGYRNCDLFLVQKVNDAWQSFIPLTTVNRPNSWESQPTISANGDRIIFTSDRMGGEGGLDLYMVSRNIDGSWGEPTNLGPAINTSRDEKSPFLHADGHTLFFSSDGHPGLGDFDVFITDWRAKSKPRNIGYPINTTDSEVGFAVAAKSPIIYFSSNEKVASLSEGRGYDFFGFKLPENAAANEVTFLTGKVEGTVDLSDEVSLRIENLQTREITRVRVDASSGTYTAVVAAENVSDYVISIESPEVGYSAVRLELDPSQEEAEVPLLEAKRLEVGESFSLNSIQFATNSYQMSALDKASLAPFVAYLQAHPSMTIELQGHTDNMGRPGDNQVLSQRRAEAVHAFLLSQGVPAAQMRAKGYGDSQPIADNRLSEGRAKNRRTVFQVLTK